MNQNLLTYLHDHLAGAQYAITLLTDLSAQKLDHDVAKLAAELELEINADRDFLEACLHELGSDSSTLKDAAAWLAQKVSRGKLNVNEPFGLFEAVELLTLGVNGKLALWNTLRALPRDKVPITPPELNELISRAETQMAALEAERIRLAQKAF
jgi:hypothetical protein